jgi:hypothetical protein
MLNFLLVWTRLPYTFKRKTELYNRIWRFYYVHMTFWGLRERGRRKLSARFWESIFTDLLGSILCHGICSLFVFVRASFVFTLGTWHCINDLHRIQYLSFVSCVHPLAICRFDEIFCVSRFNYYVLCKESVAAMNSIVSSLPGMGLLASFPWSVHTTCLQLYFNFISVAGCGIYIVWGLCCIAYRMLTSDIHRNYFEWLCVLIVSLLLFWYVDAAKEVRKQ